jgi:hypothetical protein
MATANMASTIKLMLSVVNTLSKPSTKLATATMESGARLATKYSVSSLAKMGRVDTDSSAINTSNSTPAVACQRSAYQEAAGQA